MYLTIFLLIFALWVCRADADEPTKQIDELNQQITASEIENQNFRYCPSKIETLLAIGKEQKFSKPLIIIASTELCNTIADAVLQTAALPIWKSANSPTLHPIIIYNNPLGPRVLYERGPSNSYIVFLDSKSSLWSQLVYQFSHEVCHILANYRDDQNKQGWLEESICECASLYSLRKIGQTWATNPPIFSKATYADAFTEYANKIIVKTMPVPNNDIATWYIENKSTLDTNSTNRELNNVVAVRLLAIFEKYPNSWKAIRTLNLGDTSENETLSSYLQGWYSRTAKPERPVVRDIANLFSISLQQ